MTKNKATSPKDPAVMTWRFEPLRPVRQDHAGEVAYLRIFQRHMGGAVQTVDRCFLDNEPHTFPILRVVGRIGYPTAQDCRLVATLMMWLGTGMGNGFRHRAEQILPQTNSLFTKPEAYLTAWAQENFKGHAARSLYPREMLTGHLKDVFNRDARIRDYEVLENAVAWLGTDEGQRFLKKAAQSYDRIMAQQIRAIELGRGAGIPASP